MTQMLAAKERRVVAIEADPALADQLRLCVQNDPARWPGVEIVAADILKVNIAALAPGQFHVYGNLPYYITSPILHGLFECADRIVSIHIMIQLEVANRIVARPGSREYGYLSAVCQFYTKPQIVLRIPPGAFRPPPKVNSALVQMALPGERQSLQLPDDDERGFLKFVQLCFKQKRKTLRNNLRPFVPDKRIQEALAQIGVRADCRAEQLSVPQLAGLFTQFR